MQFTKRTIEVTMNLSSTEIKVTARALYLNDKPQVSAVLDFLNYVTTKIILCKLKYVI